MGDPSRSSRWSDLGRRALSAAVLAPAALACIWVGGPAFQLLIALAAAGLAVEWVWLCGARLRDGPGPALPALLVIAVGAASLGRPELGLGVLAIGFAALWAGAGRVLLAAGMLYIGPAALALIWLRAGEAADGRLNLLFLVLVVWASDIGAYAAGRLLGGPKLAPALSPGKTWSGAVGGLVAAVLVGQGLAAALTGAPWGRAMLAATALGVASQAGDLLESAIKRHFGVKDSGRLIPGHGGLLDRLDGMLAAAPAAAAMTVLVGPGGILWQ